jgi:hypothetical protein
MAAVKGAGAAVVTGLAASGGILKVGGLIALGFLTGGAALAVAGLGLGLMGVAAGEVIETSEEPELLIGDFASIDSTDM